MLPQIVSFSPASYPLFADMHGVNGASGFLVAGWALLDTGQVEPVVFRSRPSGLELISQVMKAVGASSYNLSRA